MEESSIWFDKEMRRAVEDIMVGGGPFLGDLRNKVLLYPLELGDQD